jgi:LPS export ABC transporter protein LptC
MWGCENKMETIQNLNRKKIGVEEGKDIISYMSQSGRMKAKLTAPEMLRYQFDTPKVVFPNRLHVDFYDSLLTVESQLNAKYGRYLESENRVFLKDSVVVFNRGGDTLWTDELYWDQNKTQFYTDKPVTISQHSPRQKIRGTGMVADQNFQWFRITDPRGVVIVPDSTY